MIKNYFNFLKYSLPLLIAICNAESANSQSNPIALKPAIQIQRIMTVHNGIVRMTRDPVSDRLLYTDTDGNIYTIIQPQAGAPYDSLTFTTAQHGVEYVQCIAAHDSTLYVSGNNNSSTVLTTGLITRGKLQTNGTRVWDTLMITDPYETADYFDHLFSGMTISPAGDSIFICSGARGDHGEIQTRYGTYPNLRNVPLTTNLYALPTNAASAILLQNDSIWHTTSPYLYSRGIRNTFSLAFDGYGNLFGVENSGDRDHNEEMNWMRRGHHYGFPWKMGDTDNPQQFPGYNPAADSLIPHFSRSWRQGFWNNDPTFPAPPVGIAFEEPIQNIGPDADKFRDSLTDGVKDASDLGMTIGTFTAHRSPLGLIFDRNNNLHPSYRGDGFMLSWTKGYADSCGCTSVPDTSIGPFVDPSEDLLHLDMAFDSLTGKFQLSATRIVADFQHPIDADISGNIIYVIENGYGNTSGLYKITMPVESACTTQVSVEYTDTCFGGPASAIAVPGGVPPFEIEWYSGSGTILRTNPSTHTADTLTPLSPGDYYVIVNDSTLCRDSVHFTVQTPLSISVGTITGTSCIGCIDGSVLFTVSGGNGPYSYSILPIAGTLTDTSAVNLPAGNYQICVTDANGCSACDSAEVLEDPSAIIRLADLSESILVYPNPAAESVSIRLTNPKIEDAQVKIMDMEGRIQLTKIPSKRMLSTGLEINLDISELIPGNYLLEVESESGLHRQVLSVLR